MKILMLNAYFQPEQIAFTHLEKDLLDAFVEEGFEIDVVTPIPTRGIDKKKRSQYKDIKSEELYNGRVHVHRFWAPQEGRNPIIRAFRYFWCNLREYQMAKKFRDIDVIFAPSTPPTQGWIASKVKKQLQKKSKRCVRFVYNLQDIFPDSLVNAGMAKKGGLLWDIGRKIENYTYKNADKIIVISEDFKQNIIDKGVEKSKISLIPNWIDTMELVPIEKENNILYEKYSLNREMFFVCYSGNIGHSQNIELLIRTARSLKEKLPNVHFVLFGEGAVKDFLQKTIETEGITNIHLLPFQQYSLISQVYSLGDADLIISKKGIGGSSVPSKTWSIMSAGRPIIASFDLDSELASLILSTKTGIIIDPDDENGFIDAIYRFYSDKCLREFYGRNGREYVVKNRDKTVSTAKYIRTLRE